MDFFSSALEKAQKAVDQSLGIDERLAEEAMQASATEGDVLSVIAGLDARGVPVWNDMSASGPAQLTAVTVLQGRDLHLCAGILTRRPDGDEHPPPTRRGLIHLTTAMTVVYFFLLRPYFRSRRERATQVCGLSAFVCEQPR